MARRTSKPLGETFRAEEVVTIDARSATRNRRAQDPRNKGIGEAPFRTSLVLVLLISGVAEALAQTSTGGIRGLVNCFARTRNSATFGPSKCTLIYWNLTVAAAGGVLWCRYVRCA